MSKSHESNPLLMSKKHNTIANDLAILEVVFEDLRTKLNEMKAEGQLNHDDISILPFTIGMMAETARAFIESRQNEEDGFRVICKLLKNDISSIMPWDKFLKYTSQGESE